MTGKLIITFQAIATPFGAEIQVQVHDETGHGRVAASQSIDQGSLGQVILTGTMVDPAGDGSIKVETLMGDMGDPIWLS